MVADNRWFGFYKMGIVFVLQASSSDAIILVSSGCVWPIWNIRVSPSIRQTSFTIGSSAKLKIDLRGGSPKNGESGHCISFLFVLFFQHLLFHLLELLNSSSYETLTIIKLKFLKIISKLQSGQLFEVQQRCELSFFQTQPKTSIAYKPRKLSHRKQIGFRCGLGGLAANVVHKVYFFIETLVKVCYNKQIKLVNRMGVLSQIKKLIKATDFFYSTEMLRYEDDLQYKTLTGGIVSLAIVVTITIGFANMILNTLSLNTFTITTENTKNAIPTPSAIEIAEDSPFRFAIEIWRHNLSDYKRYFDITFRLDYQNYGLYNKTTYFTLEPCTKEFFKDYPEITQNFETLESGGWLCPPLNTTLFLEGKYSSADYNQYVISASACKNQTDPSRPCASPEQIQNFFLQRQNFLYFVIYFTNTQINPDKKDYKHYYIEDQSYALFGSSMGSEVYLEFTDYKVVTDASIWPFANLQTDVGCYAQNIGTNRPFQTNITGTYISWSLTKSANSEYYYREVQKLSMVLSFMGGMIGAISAVLFIIKIYTNVAFQFSIAFEIFIPKELKNQNPLKTQRLLQLIDENQNSEQKPKSKESTKKKLGEMSINFMTFLRFYLYRTLTFCGISRRSPQMEYAHQCKEQILKQLDIKKLLKRIIFIEHCLTKILDDYHLDVLQLKRPETPEEIREIRLKCESIVDQQLEQEQKELPEKTSINDLRLSNTQNLELGESPNGFIPGEQMRRRPQRLHQIRLTELQFKKKMQCDLNQDMMIQDVNEVKEAKGQQSRGEFKPSGRPENNKVVNLYKWKRKRESNLVHLLSTAEEGHEISKRLWKKLDKETKKRVVHYTTIGLA